jgi:hypothetical protein
MDSFELKHIILVNTSLTVTPVVYISDTYYNSFENKAVIAGIILNISE